MVIPLPELGDERIQPSLICGGRTKYDLFGTDKLWPHVKKIVLAPENDSRGHRGLVTHPLEEFLRKNQHKKYLIMVCGP